MSVSPEEYQPSWISTKQRTGIHSQSTNMMYVLDTNIPVKPQQKRQLFRHSSSKNTSPPKSYTKNNGPSVQHTKVTKDPSPFAYLDEFDDEYVLITVRI